MWASGDVLGHQPVRLVYSSQLRILWKGFFLSASWLCFVFSFRNTPLSLDLLPMIAVVLHQVQALISGKRVNTGLFPQLIWIRTDLTPSNVPWLSFCTSFTTPSDSSNKSRFETNSTLCHFISMTTSIVSADSGLDEKNDLVLSPESPPTITDILFRRHKLKPLDLDSTATEAS